MFINFGFEDIETYIIEIKIGNQIQRQSLQGNSEMVQLQFIQLLEQASHSDQPVRVRFSKEEEIWVQSQQKLKNNINYIQFANKKYMGAFPDEFKEE